VSDLNDVEEAVEDANRTLSKRNTGGGHYVVTAIEVAFMRYDPEKDGRVFETPIVRCEFPSEDDFGGKPRKD
jgi:hypothetical protein